MSKEHTSLIYYRPANRETVLAYQRAFQAEHRRPVTFAPLRHWMIENGLWKASAGPWFPPSLKRYKLWRRLWKMWGAGYSLLSLARRMRDAEITRKAS